MINTSKEMMSYSDYPIPSEYPIYMHNKHVAQYFKLYADEFGLRKYIQFQTSVNIIQMINMGCVRLLEWTELLELTNRMDI